MARHDLRRVRTFIAVEVAGSVKHRAKELLKKFKESGAEIKAVEQVQMHLTLKFLGDVQRDEILPLCKLVREVASQFQPFDLGLGGAGAFPDVDRARAIWIGVKEGMNELVTLQKTLEHELHQQLGFAKEHRKFTPHLTIARVHETSPALADMIREQSDFEADFSEVEEMAVIASFLTKDGPQYETLGHAVLGEAPTPPEEKDEEIYDREEFEDE